MGCKSTDSYYPCQQIRAFHRVPLLELSNSTGGTHEFHPWNFLELEVKRLLLTVPTEKNVGLIVSTKCMENDQQMLPISEKCTAKYTFFRKCTAT